MTAAIGRLTRALALLAGISFIAAAPSVMARPGGFSAPAGNFSHGGYSGGHAASPAYHGGGYHGTYQGGYHGGYYGGYHGGWGGRGWYGHGWGGGIYVDPFWIAGAYPYYAYPGAVDYEAYPAYQAYPAAPAAPPVYVQQNGTTGAQGDWFYCQNPAGYYPYVRNCSQAWQRVPAQPPQ